MSGDTRCWCHRAKPEVFSARTWDRPDRRGRVSGVVRGMDPAAERDGRDGTIRDGVRLFRAKCRQVQSFLQHCTSAVPENGTIRRIVPWGIWRCTTGARKGSKTVRNCMDQAMMSRRFDVTGAARNTRPIPPPSTPGRPMDIVTGDVMEQVSCPLLRRDDTSRRCGTYIGYAGRQFAAAPPSMRGVADGGLTVNAF